MKNEFYAINRDAGSFHEGQPIIVVEAHGDAVGITGGRVKSICLDEVPKVAVADKEEHEKVFTLTDAHILSLEEAEMLKEPKEAWKWFCWFGPRRQAQRIATALSEADLPKLIPVSA